MFRLTQSEWETFKRRHEPEVFTKAMMEGWIEDIKEDLMKAESGEQLDEPTTNLVNNFKEELQSFQKVTVIRNAEENSLSKGLIYEEYYIRPQQVEWIENDITKSETGEIEKSRYGKYKNTELNRKLGRVGVEFGKKKEQGSSFNDHYERSLSEGNSHERATEIANQAVKEDNPEKFEHAEKRAFGEVRSHKELKVDRGDWSAKKPDHLLIRKDTGKIIAGYASMNVPNYSKYTGPNNNTPFKIISGFNSMNPAPYLNQKPVDVMNENDWEK